MADITAAMVKELRERTSAGMMECKKALVEAQGDMQEAEDIIAKSGHKKAAKSASRTAAEGRIVIQSTAKDAVIVEVNCETDFVGRDQSFAQFCEKVAKIALQFKPTDIEALLAQPFEGSHFVEDERKALISRLGENIQIRRLEILTASPSQRIGSYTHHFRIGVLALVEGGDDILAKDVAMHIAAMKPQYISLENVPENEVAKEKEIALARAKESGKPENILEKIVQGQIQKHLNEICLLGQAFFKDPDQSVATWLKSANAKVSQMVRMEVGEGIEVVKKSFEEEVMAARGSKS